MLVLFDSTVIGNKTARGRSIYKEVQRTTGLEFDKHFGYSVSSLEEERDASPILDKMGYVLRYFSGCFNPYLCHKR